MSFDARLKENFKIFVSGPSRCGKTSFVIKLLNNIQAFCKEPPEEIIYVYSVWQSKYDEMSTIVDHFVKDDDTMHEKIQDLTVGRKVLVIFDDMIHSPSLPIIAKLFTVTARHNNLSLIFLTQSLFIDKDHFRQISRNADYFCIFKNVRDASEIRRLAQQMTPGSMELVDIHRYATKNPWSYLFIDLTQECDDKYRYRYNLFENHHYIEVIIPSGKYT